MERKTLAENIFVIPGFLSYKECAELISMSEGIGYTAATVETDTGAKLIMDVRSNRRLLYKDEILASRLWKRVKDNIPEKIGNSKAMGLNELFRFYKYEPGEQFKRHTDESYIRNEEEASYYTFLMYLNDDYSGGETVFNELQVKGAKGKLLVFLHSLEHEGAAVTAGTKYVLRTDIMYRLCAQD